MVIRNINWARAEKMTPEQRDELNITKTEGLVAIESHNPDYKQVAKEISDYNDGILGYIWSLNDI